MQYILSQEEMDSLGPKSEIVERDNALAMARTLLLEAHNFKCVHAKGNPYCDDCPCSSLNRGNKRELYLRLCWLPKNYSK